jgi:DNA-binding NtrC family response regulator
LKSILYVGCPAPERAESDRRLASAGVAIVWADTAACILAERQRGHPPILLDLSNGAAVLQDARELRQRCAETLLFAVVDTRRPDLTTEAVLAGVADVFARPLSGRRVANAIDREVAPEPPHTPSGSRSGDDLFHHSAAMRDVIRAIDRAAGVRSGVIIRGEAGTGRQLVARAIHVAGAGRSDDFIAVDCAAYDSDRLHDDLFGAGAARQNGVGPGVEHVTRESRLHAALGGTLYLQNVAEAPASVQARLARVLRDREVILMDSGAAIGVDIRPMAGVGPDFDTAVQEGRVRDDLFRRLSTTRVEVPPLRHRREDIPALANFFLREICASLRLPPKTLSRPAFSLIAALPWRGNAAELRALLHNVVRGHAGGRGISLDDLLGNVRLDGGSLMVAHGGTLKEARERFEREYIAATLEQHHGRITAAAKTLGIQRTNLYRKMRTLRVNVERPGS